MKILILGGTRFFGKEVAKELSAKGHELFIVTRGNLEPISGHSIRHLKGDRNNLKLILDRLDDKWDILFDQISYCSKDAKSVLDAVQNRVSKILLTSSEVVYDYGIGKKESDFQPKNYPLMMGQRSDFSYSDGKRQAEAYYAKNADAPLTILRIPFVMGENDYTERLSSLVEAVNKGESLAVSNMASKFLCVHSVDLARVIVDIGLSDFKGALNVGPSKSISVKEFVQAIEDVVGKKAIINSPERDGLKSDFFVPYDRVMNCDYLRINGFTIDKIENWLKELINTFYHGLSHKWQ